jgi:prepilin signal peptidase PulO-like enzyme (type II secretory pathway)
MVLMIIAVLVMLGLSLGSFVNALVWRVHEQAKGGKKNQKPKDAQQLSITKGRSLCPRCRHQLSARDLIPVFSWLSLGGKCRYCLKPISVQYPIVELMTAVLFVNSYIFWPVPLTGVELAIFGIWLIVLTGLMALLVYDLRWYLLPNRILYPLTGIASAMAVLRVVSAVEPYWAFIETLFAVLVGGGLFYILFQVSKGKWIGGGDVKLGWLLGLLVATPARALLTIFIASLLGSLVSVPLLLSGRLKKNAVIPFGPFLIVGAIIVVLFGGDILDWYRQTFIVF